MIRRKRCGPFGAGLCNLGIDEFDLGMVAARHCVAAGEFQSLDMQSKCNCAVAKFQLGAGAEF